MSHNAERIAKLRAELAQLEAEEAAEQAELARVGAARPAGIPATWLPALVKVNGSFQTVAWYDPAYTVGFLRRRPDLVPGSPERAP